MNPQKTVLITGAARGIGKKIVEILLGKYQIIMVDYNSTELNKTKEELSDLYKSNNLFAYVCNVGNSNDVNILCAKLQENGLLPDILINNAGYGGPFQILSDINDEEWDKVMNTNLRSIFNLCRNILPSMKDNLWGRIVNIASIQGLVGANLSSTYIASKHGVIGYTKAIAAEWGKYTITCNAICPGYVETNMGSQDDKISGHHNNIISRTPLGRIAKTQDIADLVEFLISEKAKFINGSIITIDGGLMADIGLT